MRRGRAVNRASGVLARLWSRRTLIAIYPRSDGHPLLYRLHRSARLRRDHSAAALLWAAFRAAWLRRRDDARVLFTGAVLLLAAARPAQRPGRPASGLAGEPHRLGRSLSLAGPRERRVDALCGAAGGRRR